MSRWGGRAGGAGCYWKRAEESGDSDGRGIELAADVIVQRCGARTVFPTRTDGTVSAL